MFSMPKYIQYPKNDIAQDVGHDDLRFFILHGHGHFFITHAFVRFFRRVRFFRPFFSAHNTRIRTSDPLPGVVSTRVAKEEPATAPKKTESSFFSSSSGQYAHATLQLVVSIMNLLPSKFSS